MLPPKLHKKTGASLPAFSILYRWILKRHQRTAQIVYTRIIMRMHIIML